MKIGVLGTGVVGQTLSTKLVQLGHDVKMGSREASNEKAKAWADGAGDLASTGTFSDAASSAEVVINATSGTASIDALKAAGSENLAGKVLIDVANPLDFSTGQLQLKPGNNDSLAEEIQRTFPDVRVVKSFNTVTAPVMVAPSLVSGAHNIFVAGNDNAAKATTRGLLTSFGWPDESIVDVGDITGARGLEAWLHLWVRLFQTTGSPFFNLQIVK